MLTITSVYKYILGSSILLALSGNLLAEELNVQSLSEGACWYEQGEALKLVSFNDKQSAVLKQEVIDEQVEKLVKPLGAKTSSSSVSLHCGGYGMSLVIKTEVNQRPVCLWAKLEKGKLSLRSLGGLEETKNILCDGYKWGELIIGLKSLDQKALLESELFSSVIKSVTVIMGTTLKITLWPEHNGREPEVMDDLKKKMDLRYIELNLFQHPVGEGVAL